MARGERLYVLGIDPRRNRVTVGDRQALAAPGLVGRDLHWIGSPSSGDERQVTVRIRSRHPGIGAVVRQRAGGRVEVEFAEPQLGVTPGQAAVFYDGSRVVGGCWIDGPLP